MLVPRTVQADDGSYLLEKTITWGDGTTESVSVDRNGFFVLNGVKRRLVGFTDSLNDFPSGHYYDAENLAIFHTELDYLQSMGVRVLQLQFRYEYGANESRYDGILQLCYDHKMLVIPIFSLAYWNATLATPDYNLTGETVSAFVPRWISKVTSYSNVVALVMENEIDWPTHPEDGTYDAAHGYAYMNFLYGLFRANTHLPIVTKFGAAFPPSGDLADALVNSCLKFSAIPCIDPYRDTAADFTSICNDFKTWYNSKGKSTQMWVTEICTPQTPPYLAADLTKAMIDAVLAANASVVCLFEMNAHETPTLAFFDDTGTKIANTDTLMANMATWQAAISQPATTPTDTYTITATAGANGSISPSGAVTVNHGADQSFTITTDAGYHVADVLVDGASVGAVTSYTFTSVTADHTISASFAADTVTTFTITASAGANGSMSPSGAVAVNYGADQAFAIAANTGYHVADVLVDGASVGAVASYNFTNVTADHTISASFTQNQYTLTVDVNSSGSVAKVPNQATYSFGSAVQMTATADPGSSFSGWSGDLTGSANPATIAVDGNKTVTATFTIKNLSPTVTIKLVDSDGKGLSGGVIEYYSNGWKTIGTTPSNGELAYNFPETLGTYNFRLSYAGASESKSQNIATNPVVVFQTSKVTMKLLDSANNELPGGGTQYYAGSWKTFGSGNATAYMELLPLTYNFRLSYAGASQAKSQNITTNPVVVFQTSKVTMKLLDSANNELPGVGTQYYAGSWKTFGSGSTTAYMELLPLTYNFRLSYAGASQDKSQNIATNPNVVFQTGTVHSDSGSCTYYYAGGWKTFSQELQLLPGTYNFRFKDGTADKNYGILANTVNHIR